MTEAPGEREDLLPPGQSFARKMDRVDSEMGDSGRFRVNLTQNELGFLAGKAYQEVNLPRGTKGQARSVDSTITEGEARLSVVFDKEGKGFLGLQTREENDIRARINVVEGEGEEGGISVGDVSITGVRRNIIGNELKNLCLPYQKQLKVLLHPQ